MRFTAYHRGPGGAAQGGTRVAHECPVGNARWVAPTGAMRVEPDRRHLTLPVIGTVRTHENTRRVERLIAKG